MSARRVLVGSAIALLMPASLLLSTQTSSANPVSTVSPDAAAKTSPRPRRRARSQGQGHAAAVDDPDVGRRVLRLSLAPHWSHRGQDYEKDSKRLCSKGDPSAVKVSGGKVRISVLKDRKRNGKCKARERGKVVGKYAYRLNGHIGTENQFSFKYGTIAARIKFQKSRGQHGSFWMQPAEAGGNEMDIIEYFGDKHPQGGLTSFIHWYKGKKSIKTGSWIKKSDKFLKNKRDSWSKNFHVFSVEWKPDLLIFRIDGKESWRTRTAVSQAAQYPILSLLASDYELSEMKDKQLPQHMYVDWIRVWEDTP